MTEENMDGDYPILWRLESLIMLTGITHEGDNLLSGKTKVSNLLARSKPIAFIAKGQYMGK